MFWIILLIVVAVIVVLIVRGSTPRAREKRRLAEQKRKEEATAAEKKKKEEDERFLMELESKAATGDAAAEKLFNYLRFKLTQPLYYGSSKSIRFRGLQINTVFSTAGNTLLQIIAESDGWDDFSIEKETDDTQNPREGSMRCSFTAPSGESCSVTWGYKKGVYDFILADIKLRTNSVLVDAILRIFEERMICFLKSQGASPVPGYDFDHLARFWSS